MGLIIGTDMNALTAHRSLNKSGAAQTKASARLSTGKRINSAADDAAGMAISEKMRAQIRGLEKAEQNVTDGISLLEIAEAAMGDISDMIQRIRELTVMAANDTYNYSDGDRQKIQTEVLNLKQAIDDIALTTEFNGKKLMDGSLLSGETKNKLMADLHNYMAGQLGTNGSLITAESCIYQLTQLLSSGANVSPGDLNTATLVPPPEGALGSLYAEANYTWTTTAYRSGSGTMMTNVASTSARLCVVYTSPLTSSTSTTGVSGTTYPWAYQVITGGSHAVWACQRCTSTYYPTTSQSTTCASPCSVYANQTSTNTASPTYPTAWHNVICDTVIGTGTVNVGTGTTTCGVAVTTTTTSQTCGTNSTCCCTSCTYNGYHSSCARTYYSHSSTTALSCTVSTSCVCTTNPTCTTNTACCYTSHTSYACTSTSTSSTTNTTTYTNSTLAATHFSRTRTDAISTITYSTNTTTNISTSSSNCTSGVFMSGSNFFQPAFFYTMSAQGASGPTTTQCVAGFTTCNGSTTGSVAMVQPSNVAGPEELTSYINALDQYIEEIKYVQANAIDYEPAFPPLNEMIDSILFNKNAAIEMYAELVYLRGLALSYEAYENNSDNSGLYLQVGANSGQGLTVDLLKLTTHTLGIADANIDSKASVDSDYYYELTNQIKVLDYSLEVVSRERARLGSTINRLNFILEATQIANVAQVDANSRITDADMAKEVMALTVSKVLQNAGQAMLAQANNQRADSVMALLNS